MKRFLWLMLVTVACIACSAATDDLKPRGPRTASPGNDDVAQTTYSTVVTSATIASRMYPYGTNGYVWTMSGGVPVWAPSAGGSSGHAQNTDIGTDAVDWNYGLFSDSWASDVTTYYGGAWAGGGIDIPYIRYSNDNSGSGWFETNRVLYASEGHAGDGSLLTDVDAELLDGQAGSYYRNAGNLNAGNLAHARMPSGAGTWSLGGRLQIKGQTLYATGIGNDDPNPDEMTTAVEIWNSQVYRPDHGGSLVWRSGTTPLRVYDPATSSIIWRMDSGGAMYPYPANGGTMYAYNRIKMGGTTSDETTSPIDIKVDGGYSGPMIDVGNARQYASADTLTYGYAGSVNAIYGLFHMDVHAQRNVYGANGVIVGPGRQYQSGGPAGSLYIESHGTAGVPDNGKQITRIRTDQYGAWFNNHIGWKEGSVYQRFWFDDRIECPEINTTGTAYVNALQTTGTAYVNALQTTGTATLNGNTVLGDSSGDAVTFNASTVNLANVPSGSPTAFLGRNASNQLVRFTTATTLLLPDNVAYVNVANAWTAGQTLPGVTVQGNLAVSTGTTTLAGPVVLSSSNVTAVNLPVANAGGFLMRQGDSVGVMTSGTADLGLRVLSARDAILTGSLQLGAGISNKTLVIGNGAETTSEDVQITFGNPAGSFETFKWNYDVGAFQTSQRIQSLGGYMSVDGTVGGDYTISYHDVATDSNKYITIKNGLVVDNGGI